MGQPPTCTQVSGVDLSLAGSGTLYLGDVAQFRADLAPDEAAKPYSYTLDYGDGSAPVNGSSSDDPFTFSYTYTNAGTYTVVLEAWNCAITQPVSDSLQVEVIEPVTEEYVIYLPIVVRND
jgi:PKD repeat protein